MVNNTKKLLQSLLFGLTILTLTGCSQKHAMDMQPGHVPSTRAQYYEEESEDDYDYERRAATRSHPLGGRHVRNTCLMVGSIMVAGVIIEGGLYKFDHLKQLYKLFLTPIDLFQNSISTDNCVVAPVLKSSCISNTLRFSAPCAPNICLPETSFQRGLISPSPTQVSSTPAPIISPSVGDKVYNFLKKTTSEYENEIKQLNKKLA